MSLFRKQAVQQYMDPDARGGLLRVEPPSGARMFAGLALLFAVASWIAITNTVQVTASGRGVVRPVAGVFVVRAPVTGKVVSIERPTGKTAAAGAPLITIEVANAASPASEPFADLLAKRRAQIAILERTGDDSAASVLRQATAELEREAERLRGDGQAAVSAQRVAVPAPAAGMVDALVVKVGDRVTSGEAIGKVVPQSKRFVGHMTLAGRHRVHVAPGGKVRLRFDAYPSDEAGFGSARIVRVSADPVSADVADPLLASMASAGAEPLYAVELAFEAMPPRASADIANGMAFTGEVVLRERRIITLLFPPLARIID